jgi:polyhydroxyalkanoate synthesis regulator phasin
MAQSDVLKRYLDAGMAFTQLTRTRAEGIVKELVRAGEVRRERTQETVDDLIERSRRNTEALVNLVRKEVNSQLSQLGLATKLDLSRLERRLGFGGKKAPAKKTAAKKGPAKKAAAKKGPAKKTAAKKAPAKKTAAKKAPAKKAPGAASMTGAPATAIPTTAAPATVPVSAPPVATQPPSGADSTFGGSSTLWSSPATSAPLPPPPSGPAE